MSKVSKPHPVTLQDLLNDERFGDNSANIHHQQAFENDYSSSLNSYIQGNEKRALEKMFSCGLLDESFLNTDLRIWKLLLSALCDVSLDSVGVSLQRVIGRLLTNEAYLTTLKKLVARDPLYEQIGTLLKYFQSCHKYLKLDENNNSSNIMILEDDVREYIREVSTSVSTMQEIQQFNAVVVFYLFQAQHELLHKKLSKTLYRKLCDYAPAVSDKLKVNNDSNSFEKTILEKLETKKKKKKLPHVKRSADKEPVNTLKITRKNATTEVQPTRNTKLTSFTLPTMWEYLLSRKFNHKMAIFVLVTLFFSLKRSRTLYMILQRANITAKTIIRYFLNVMRVVSSV